MTFRMSTGARNAYLGKKDSITATTISFAASGNVISDSGDGLLAAGFRPGDYVVISGSTNNNILTKLVSVNSSGASMVTEEDLTDESAGAEITIQAIVGKAFADMFRNHIIHIYSGTPPATADASETGTLLAKLTKASGTVVPGTAENGLNFDADSIASGLLQNDSEIISGTGISSGIAGYYRMYDNGEITGSSTTAKRVQGEAGTASAQLILTSLNIVADATVTASKHEILQPAS